MNGLPYVRQPAPEMGLQVCFQISPLYLLPSFRLRPDLPREENLPFQLPAQFSSPTPTAAAPQKQGRSYKDSIQTVLGQWKGAFLILLIVEKAENQVAKEMALRV